MVPWWTNGFYSSYLCENGWEVTYRSRKILKDICITKAHSIMRDSTQNLEMWGNYTASKNWMDWRMSFCKCNWSGALLATLTSLCFFFNYSKSYLNLSSHINDNISLSYMCIMKLCLLCSIVPLSRWQMLSIPLFFWFLIRYVSLCRAHCYNHIFWQMTLHCFLMIKWSYSLMHFKTRLENISHSWT